MRLRILQQLIQAIFDNITILVMFKFHEDDVHQLYDSVDIGFLGFHQSIDGRPNISYQMRAIVAQNIEDFDKGKS